MDEWTEGGGMWGAAKLDGAEVELAYQGQLGTVRFVSFTCSPCPPLSHMAMLSSHKHREQIKLASRLSGVSTASMGKFDKRLKGEKAGERAPLGKRRKFADVTDTATERGKVGGRCLA